MDFAVDAALADASRDELRVLAAVIQNEDELSLTDGFGEELTRSVARANGGRGPQFRCGGNQGGGAVLTVH